MAVRHRRFVRSDAVSAAPDEVADVDRLAALLEAYLDASAAEIDVAHVRGAPSKDIQTIVAELLQGRLGFRQEIVLTPVEGFVTHARPDFVYSLGEGRGIIAEVERGGTTTNNHDLKDLWKAHIAPDVQHLFLIVPNANWNEAGTAREHPYSRVLTRLGSFFGDARREVDVVSVHIFGYGRET